MAQLLGNVAVGTVLKLKENGVAQNYIVVHQGLPSSMYDSSCNGTWLLRQDIISNYGWGSSNSWDACLIKVYVDKQLISIYDSSIQSVIKTVKIPYCVGNGSSQVNSGASGYSCKLFLLGGYEVGITQSDFHGVPIDGTKLSYFISGRGTDANNKRSATLNSSKSTWWLRSPYYDFSSADSWFIQPTGDCYYYTSSSSYGIRPAMVMPTDLIVDDSNNITANQLVPPINITVPSIAMQQQTLPISWTPVSVSGADITYQLQRNTDNSGWTTIYTGADTSYTDTVGTWTQVSYRVATVALGSTSDYTQSTIIPVSDPSVLVISGQDGNLGTLTSNVPYTVSSNTGNQISLTRTVNGAQVVTLTVDSGFAYSIPVADLPTGTGTIQITASVENTSQQIQTATRTWTYYKTPIDIPPTGGIAQLTQNGQNIWPTTIADAVQAPVYLGGNLNAALNKLGQAALYTKIGSPKYNQVTVDLSKVSVGDEVNLPYNGVMVPHIVVHIGNPDASIYDASCDGVWLLRKDCVAQGVWNSSNVNELAGSTIMSTMQGYVANYDSEVQSAIKTVKIPYCVGNGNTTINTLGNGLECKMFPLSIYEIGYSQSDGDGIPLDGAKLSYFLAGKTDEAESKRIAKFENAPVLWWLRSPCFLTGYDRTQFVFRVGQNGAGGAANAITSYALRNCFIMPVDFSNNYYVDSSNRVYSSQSYTQGGSITDVFGYDVPICQYEVGSYVGTGVYGESNPNTLTFGFQPKIVTIVDTDSAFIRAIFVYNGYGIIWSTPENDSSTLPSFGVTTTWADNTLTWYNTSFPNLQMNTLGTTYDYIAIG